MVGRKLLALGVAALASGVMATPALAIHSWGDYHWARTANPLTVKLGDNMTSAWDDYLAQASTDWSRNVSGNPLRTSIVPGSTTPKQCRATLGRVEVCNAAYGNRGWLGVATISVNQSHITQATTKMNDTYYATALTFSVKVQTPRSTTATWLPFPAGTAGSPGHARPTNFAWPVIVCPSRSRRVPLPWLAVMSVPSVTFRARSA